MECGAAMKKVIEFLSTFVCLLVIGDYCSGLVIARAAEVDAIIGNVRSAEELFVNCDVSAATEYRRGKDPGDKHIVKRQSSETHMVSQDGMMRVHSRENITGGGDASQDEEERIRAFDGKVTRVINNGIANIVDGPTVDSNAIRPHMILLQGVTYPVPLSVLLQGYDAISAYPGDVSPLKSREFDVTYLGQDKWNDLDCEKLALRHVSTKSNKVEEEFHVWLAVNRNYIPVKVIGFDYKWSKKLPKYEAEVGEFREVEPGMWFPVGASSEINDAFALKQGRKISKISQTYKVSDVDLNPTYPESYFQDVKFPDGTMVYDVDAAGRITKGRTVGDPPSSANVSLRFWLIVVNVILLGTVVVGWLTWRFLR
ncbi:hypothetical protein C5Y96_16120 [Blastopirellula marina]|uniref:Uncharacterized protein n=2 Tax=Pirellulales TaxID=2691354 RepID=A0A2S8F8C9_9BACT|nr:hypothetical protein C5Y96_16120 [Blastopirellula marina]RCS49118.1 hypothetical protein DTL36_16140 [Bremerella cremea]